jgi:hypothetical protein
MNNISLNTAFTDDNDSTLDNSLLNVESWYLEASSSNDSTIDNEMRCAPEVTNYSNRIFNSPSSILIQKYNNSPLQLNVYKNKQSTACYPTFNSSTTQSSSDYHLSSCEQNEIIYQNEIFIDGPMCHSDNNYENCGFDNFDAAIMEEMHAANIGLCQIAIEQQQLQLKHQQQQQQQQQQRQNKLKLQTRHDETKESIQSGKITCKDVYKKYIVKPFTKRFNSKQNQTTKTTSQQTSINNRRNEGIVTYENLKSTPTHFQLSNVDSISQSNGKIFSEAGDFVTWTI